VTPGADRPSRATRDESRIADVVIVGFGPVGATLAGLLGRRGIDVVAVDRERDVFQLPRAAHIDHTGLRTLQELGLLDSLLPRLLKNAGLDFVTAGGELLIRVPGAASSTSGIPASMYFHQPDLDQCIRDAVALLPSVEIRYGSEVIDIEDRGDHSVVRTVDRDGAQRDIGGHWVVGCDGAWSTTRDIAGLALDDLDFEERWIVIDLILPEPAPETLATWAMCRCDPHRPAYSIPMPSRRHRFELMLMPGEDDTTMLAADSITDLVTPWLGSGDFTIERSAVYTFHGLVASRWRSRSVLIAGDAAHQMPPFLGQGMCSGIRDAANLAWKLYHVLRLGAPTRLLDTYCDERSAHVRQIVDAVLSYGRIICTIDPEQAAERDRVMLADPASPEQRMRFRLPPLPSGPLVLDGGGDLFVQPTRVGVSMLDDLVGQRFAVWGRTAHALGSTARWWSEAVGAFVTTLDEAPQYAPAIRRWLDSVSADVVVVRPDRYVLWRGPHLDFLTPRVADLISSVNVSSPPGREAAG
jgi:3-(3-hydroxy-phenyl)propionate hydroxylase